MMKLTDRNTHKKKNSKAQSANLQQRMVITCDKNNQVAPTHSPQRTKVCTLTHPQCESEKQNHSLPIEQSQPGNIYSHIYIFQFFYGLLFTKITVLNQWQCPSVQTWTTHNVQLQQQLQRARNPTPTTPLNTLPHNIQRLSTAIPAMVSSLLLDTSLLLQMSLPKPSGDSRKLTNSKLSARDNTG